MSENEQWRELYRTDDLLRARAVATSIAAMEFEVHLIGADERDDQALTEEPQPAPADFSGPFIIQVRHEDFSTLNDALDEIVREQEDFDVDVEAKKHPRASVGYVITVILVLVAVYLLFQYWT
jgi:hypothetical protein